MTHQSTTTRPPGPVTLVLGLALALGVAACGGAAGTGEGVVSLQDPSASPGASGSPAASVDPEEAMLAFQACMKEHGIDIHVATLGSGDAEGGSVRVTGPDNGAPVQPGTGEMDPQAMQAADEACRHLLPAGGRPDPDATIPPEQVDAMLGFAKCMREHGIDFPDPQFGSGGGVSIQVGGPDGEGGVDPMSDAFQAAQEACAAEMPQGAPFVVGGTSSESAP
jgi:hypothetical protein